MRRGAVMAEESANRAGRGAMSKNGVTRMADRMEIRAAV